MKKIRLVTAAVMAVVAATCFVGTSHAGWGSYGSYGSYGSSGGSYGSYGGSYGSSGYGSSGYGSSGYARPGLLARIAHRIHNHFHHHSAGSYGSSGYTSYYSSNGSSGYGSSGYGSSGYTTYSYGSSGYGSSGYGSSGYTTSSYSSSSYGSHGSVSYSAPAVTYGATSYASAPVYTASPSYSYGTDAGCSTCGGGTTIYSTPVYSTPSAAPGTGTPTPAEGAYAPNGDEVLLTVNVPDDAKVLVNGNATKSTGGVRQFVSRGLQKGKLYDYELQVEGTVEGKPVSFTKRVSLRAGENRQVSFSDSEKPTSIETKLTLHVPENAQVTLAGNKTTATGTDRVFSTTDLAAGQAWDAYTIVVTMEVDGQVMTKEKTLTMVAGNEYELDFDFESPKVAMR